MTKLLWVRADKQGSMPMGEYQSVQDAEAAMPAALEEMLAQCADDAQRDTIRRGAFECVEEV